MGGGGAKAKPKEKKE
jgi:26S proteasome regulatory subunit, ATPase 3, interacting protein